MKEAFSQAEWGWNLILRNINLSVNDTGSAEIQDILTNSARFMILGHPEKKSTLYAPHFGTTN